MKKTFLTFIILIALLSSLYAVDYQYSAGVIYQNDTAVKDARIGAALDAAIMLGKDEKLFKMIAMERTDLTFSFDSSTLGIIASTYFGAHITPVGGLFVEPMAGAGFALFLGSGEGKSVVDLTAGGMINIGYSFGKGRNLFCYAGCEVQYAVLFFQRLFYSAHAGVGVRF